MPKFKSKCVFCTDNSIINWSHEGCSSSKGENIDIEGYVTCNDCGKKMDVIAMRFYCSTHKEHKSFTKNSQIRALITLISKNDGIDDDFLDTLYENLKKRWDDTH